MYKLEIEFNKLAELNSFVKAMASLGNPTESTTTTLVVPPPAPVQPVTPPPYQQPLDSPAPAPVAPVVSVPIAKPQEYTTDQLASAGVALMDQGKEAEIFQLFDQFGVQMMTQLAPEQYGAFAQGLRALGAQI